MPNITTKQCSISECIEKYVTLTPPSPIKGEGDKEAPPQAAGVDQVDTYKECGCDEQLFQMLTVIGMTKGMAPELRLRNYDARAQIAETYRDKNGVGVALVGRAKYLASIGKKEEAANDYFRAAEAFIDAGSYKEALVHLIWVEKLGHYGDQLFNTMARVYQNIGDKRNAANMLAKSAAYAEERGSHAQALEYYEKSHDLWEGPMDANEKIEYQAIVEKIISLHMRNGHFDKALRFVKMVEGPQAAWLNLSIKGDLELLVKAKEMIENGYRVHSPYDLVSVLVYNRPDVTAEDVTIKEVEAAVRLYLETTYDNFYIGRHESPKSIVDRLKERFSELLTHYEMFFGKKGPSRSMKWMSASFRWSYVAEIAGVLNKMAAAVERIPQAFFSTHESSEAFKTVSVVGETVLSLRKLLNADVIESNPRILDGIKKVREDVCAKLKINDGRLTPEALHEAGIRMGAIERPKLPPESGGKAREGVRRVERRGREKIKP